MGSSQKSVYKAHYGTVPQVRLGRIHTINTCDGSLYAKGIIFGEITRRSTRTANGIITNECLNILQTNHPNQLSLDSLSDAVWRTLCADRDNRGCPAPAEYRSRMIKLSQLNPDAMSRGPHNDHTEIIPSFDVKELLATKLPEDVKEVLEVIRDAVWNRRTFRGDRINGNGNIIVLIPQHAAKVGDQLCILYGCSVPVVLRKQWRGSIQYHWQLFGEAYVHGFMDGERIFPLSSARDERTEVEFEIR